MNVRIMFYLWTTLCLTGICFSEENHRMKTENSETESQLRQRMVEKQIRARGITDERVLRAMLAVPRHLFVPQSERRQAYEDYPLSLGYGQTISQPYIVAYMTEALHLDGDEKVLEIGTGSGYQAAVLAECAKSVFTIEIIEPLCESAKQRLAELGYSNCSVRCGDGYAGWPEEAPFDAIIVTAAPKKTPRTLIDQLAPGGRMILPVGAYYQHLLLVAKDENGRITEKTTMPVRFVPMTGGGKK